jgi:2-hydroxychromene-2-carboxylate isomerase
VTKIVDFYFTVLSSYAYLSAPRVAEVRARTGASFIFKPMDIMRVFEASGTTPPPKQPDARKAYRATDLSRVAKAHDMPINLKPAFWPASQNLASGVIIAAQEGGNDPMALTHAILKAVWADDLNIADAATLENIAVSCGFDGEDLVGQADSDAVQAIFEANTKEAIEKNVFGSPSFFVDGELFWGQDRLSYVEAAL